MRAQLLHIVDQMDRGVVLDLAEREGPAAAALVEDHDPVEGRVEEPAVGGVGAGARPAVEEHDRDTFRIAALLIVHPMGRGEGQEACVVGLDFREQVLGGHCASIWMVLQRLYVAGPVRSTPKTGPPTDGCHGVLRF
jgi:hypothetical protein